ncbi:hypothetical protein CGLO_15309 [Colletotrichum gloeosporioides Cg-14]
MLGYK